MTARATYLRPRLGWVKRRARRLQHFYGIARRLAVLDAMRDYAEFCLGRSAQLVSIPGGQPA